MTFPHRKNKIGWFCNVLQQAGIPYCLFLSDFSEKHREGDLIVRGHRAKWVSFLEGEEKPEASSAHFLLEVWGVRDPDISVSILNS